MSERLPSVSFIIPTYNEEKIIAKCLRSVLIQDYPKEKLEILVVDGLSSDKTVDIARNYHARIITNKKRIVPEARNLGIENSKGEILAFLDADCELPQRKWLRLMVAPLVNNPNVAGSIPILLPKRSNPAISRLFSLMQADPIIVFAYGSGKEVNNNYVTEENYFPTGVFVLKKRLLIEAKRFKSSLKRSEDVDVTYRIVKLGYAFKIVPEAKLYHRFVSSYPAFLRKTYKRVSSFVEFSSLCEFNYVPKDKTKNKFLKNMLYDIMAVGALVRVVRGIKKDRDIAWLYYPVTLFSTVLIYIIVLGSSREGRKLVRELAS